MILYYLVKNPYLINTAPPPPFLEATVDKCLSFPYTNIIGYQIHAHSHGTSVGLYYRTSAVSIKQCTTSHSLT